MCVFCPFNKYKTPASRRGTHTNPGRQTAPEAANGGRGKGGRGSGRGQGSGGKGGKGKGGGKGTGTPAASDKVTVRVKSEKD